LTAELAAHGISNPGSSVDLDRFLRANGLAGQFPPTKTGRLSTRDKVLKEREGLHAALPLVRRWRKLGQLTSDPAVNGLITAADGRVHAEFWVLGSDTGRTQSSCPNLMGIGRVFRPLVRATGSATWTWPKSRWASPPPCSAMPTFSTRSTKVTSMSHWPR